MIKKGHSQHSIGRVFSATSHVYGGMAALQAYAQVDSAPEKNKYLSLLAKSTQELIHGHTEEASKSSIMTQRPTITQRVYNALTSFTTRGKRCSKQNTLGRTILQNSQILWFDVDGRISLHKICSLLASEAPFVKTSILSSEISNSPKVIETSDVVTVKQNRRLALRTNAAPGSINSALPRIRSPKHSLHTQEKKKEAAPLDISTVKLDCLRIEGISIKIADRSNNYTQYLINLDKDSGFLVKSKNNGICFAKEKDSLKKKQLQDEDQLIIANIDVINTKESNESHIDKETTSRSTDSSVCFSTAEGFPELINKSLENLEKLQHNDAEENQRYVATRVNSCFIEQPEAVKMESETVVVNETLKKPAGKVASKKSSFSSLLMAIIGIVILMILSIVYCVPIGTDAGRTSILYCV